jgi:hypothetical protein
MVLILGTQVINSDILDEDSVVEKVNERDIDWAEDLLDGGTMSARNFDK